MATVEAHPLPRAEAVASFRDPDGALVRTEGRILRYVTPDAAARLKSFLDTAAAASFLASGKLISTRFLEHDGPADAPCVLEHEPVAFPSYPYEWPAEMLHCAAALTLELNETLRPFGYWTKDATPYNVLFRGPEPVFVDLPSFEKRDPLDCTWRAYAQFIRTFLLVLLAARRLQRHPAELLLLHRDGPEPRQVYNWASRLQRLLPGFLTLVTLPVWMERGRPSEDAGLYRKRPARSAEEADYIVEHLYGGLRRHLKRLEPPSRESTWTGYLDHKSLYSIETLAAKASFVSVALAEFRPAAVLDVGCNEGHFSRLAARGGARVVGIDSDAAVAGRLWRQARAERLDILPLVVDLARPTPGVGWRNEECLPFLERARGQFDLVLMLAVIHHLLVTERVPLRALLELAASLTRDLALIEFVGPRDPMFRRLVRGRDLLYEGLTVDEFEREAGCFFTTIRKQKLDGLDRWLFLFRRHSAPNAPAS